MLNIRILLLLLLLLLFDLPPVPMNDREKQLELEHAQDGHEISSSLTPERSRSPLSQGLPVSPGCANSERHSVDTTSSDSENGQESGDVEPRDLETLSRVSSGPPYSVFSPSMKWWIVFMNCFSAFISPTTANIYFPAIPAIAESLGVTVGQVNLTLTTYIIMQGLAPTIFGDFGDVAGRRPAFIIAFTIYLGANIGLALQRNYAVLLVLRMLQSGGSSGTIALSYAVVADIAPSSERGKYMGIVGAGITMGPAIGPIIGGLLSQFLGWPSIFWFLTIITIVWMVPYVLTVPETGRKVVGNGSIPPQGWNRTLLDHIRLRHQNTDRSSIASKQRKIPIPNPFHTLKIILQKDMAMILLYNGLLYVGFMMVTATLASQFEDIYGFNQLQLGLCYLPIGVGTTITSVGSGFVLDWNFWRVAKKLDFPLDRKRGIDLKDFPIEKVRLQIMYFQLVLGTIAYIGWAWSLHLKTFVAVPLLMSFFIGLCVTGSFQILNILIVDLYPESPATATAANNLVRCSFGAIFTATIEDMIAAMGRGWAFTFIALLFACFSPTLWVIQTYGPKFREERRQRMRLSAEKKEARLREKAGSPTEGGVVDNTQS